MGANLLQAIFQLHYFTGFITCCRKCSCVYNSNKLCFPIPSVSTLLRQAWADDRQLPCDDDLREGTGEKNMCVWGEL